MKTIRTLAETRTLSAEAEQRARAGESLAAIAQSMGIASSTLSDWALKGGWRRKDLDSERAAMIARLTAERIAAMRGESPAPLEIKSADAAEQTASQAAGTDKVPPEISALATAQVLLNLGMIEEADKAVRLASRFVLFQDQLARRSLLR